MSIFDSYIDQIDTTFWHELCESQGRTFHYKKGDYFARAEKTSRHMGLVKQGYFKYTVTDTSGNEHISGFSFAGTFIGDYLSVTRKFPCTNDIVAVTDAEVLTIDCHTLNDALRTNIPRHLQIADALFHQAYNTYLDMHRLSPKERYMALLKCDPNILQNISLKELASYLNITPTHFSRIRKEITFNQE